MKHTTQTNDLFARTIPPEAAARIAKLEALAARPGTLGEGVAARAALARIRARVCVVVNPRVQRRKPCRCGSTTFLVEKGKGPHAHHLRCAVCGRGGLWMSHADAAELNI
jgi:hypothetical protein